MKVFTHPGPSPLLHSLFQDSTLKVLPCLLVLLCLVLPSSSALSFPFLSFFVFCPCSSWVPPFPPPCLCGKVSAMWRVSRNAKWLKCNWARVACYSQVCMYRDVMTASQSNPRVGSRLRRACSPASCESGAQCRCSRKVFCCGASYSEQLEVGKRWKKTQVLQ